MGINLPVWVHTGDPGVVRMMSICCIEMRV